MPTRVTAGRLTRALQAASIAFAFAVAVAAGVARASGEWAGIVGGTATKVPRLGTGDLAGFVSPASPPYDIYDPASYVPHVVESMASLGLNATFGAHAFVQMGYLAGTDEMRASDVMEAFSNSSVNAIIANRGGYGCPRILDLLDYDVIAQNPKPLVGYSDLTALIIAVYARTGMVTFHGPMGIDDWVGSVNSQYFSDVIMQGTLVTFQNSPDWQSELYTINKGKARGKLIGGNLSLLTAMIGWQYLTADLFKGAILFLEDVDEPVYSLDRMMRQLELAGFFDDLAGIVWGVCSSCDASPRAPSDTITLREMLEDYIVPLHIPAYYGAMFGHIDDMWTLPIGVEVELDADAFTVTMLESAVL